jgi:hypothetical protein
MYLMTGSAAQRASWFSLFEYRQVEHLVTAFGATSKAKYMKHVLSDWWLKNSEIGSVFKAFQKKC